MSNKISWTDATWSPVTGCDPISPGCANCWAKRMSHRLAGRYGYPAAPDQFNVTLHPDRLEQPLRWRKPVVFSFARWVICFMRMCRQSL